MENKQIIAKIIRKFTSKKGNGWTLGELVVGQHKWYTCEDEYREVKVRGETRLKAGVWKLVFNTAGGKNVKYKEIMGKGHMGMIEILTPHFDNTYIHIGNDESDTYGCPLVGKGWDKAAGKVSQSVVAYKEMYPILAKIMQEAHKAGKEVYIEIIDTEEVEI